MSEFEKSDEELQSQTYDFGSDPGLDPGLESDHDPSSARGDPVKRTWNRYAAEGYNMIHNNNTNGRRGLSAEEECLLDGAASEKQNGRSEKQLTAVVVVCILLIVGLAVALVAISLEPRAQEEVCQSPDCIIMAGTMLSKMNLSLDPCHDFYQYSCSAAINDPMNPPDKMKWSIFNEVEKRNMAVLKRLLDEPGDGYMGSNSTAIKKAKDMYNGCMNVTLTESMSNEPMLQVIEAMGGWPILPADITGGGWSQDDWHVEDALAAAYGFAQAPLLSFGVTIDDKNSSIQRLAFDQPSLTLSDYNYYIGNDTKKYHDGYVKFYVTIATLLGASTEKATAAAEACWNLEVAIATARDLPMDRTDPEVMYNLTTLEELDLLAGPGIDLTSYVGKLFDKTIPDSELVLVYSRNYISNMRILVEQADKDELANYITWVVVMSMVPSMPLPFRLAQQELSQVLYGVQSSSALWETCVGLTDGVLGFATGALIVEYQFSEEDRDRVVGILTLIREAFKRGVPELDWMDDITKAKAIEKADAVIQKIGFPNFIKQPVKLDKYYEKLDILEDDPFQNILNERKFYVDRELEKRGKAPDRTEWSMSPATVNAYYSPVGNEIVFPAGILQKPFYDSAYLRSLLFGGVGVVMGHELTHAFDNSGRLYDKDGNLNNWWTNESAEAFVEKAQCLVDEYDHFRVDGTQLNGLTTLGENIADNGGVKTAFQAYHDWLHSETVREPVLPGLNMTGDQLFFLSFAQIWCAYYTPEYAQQSLVSDSHSYAKYRVIGVLKNMPEFSTAFQCPVGSKMNPAKKCDVW